MPVSLARSLSVCRCRCLWCPFWVPRLLVGQYQLIETALHPGALIGIKYRYRPSGDWDHLLQGHPELTLSLSSPRKPDSYDILHLVPSIPSLSPPTDVNGSASGFGFGFEDLPSDHEELFFLNSSADRVDLERRKKRRKLQDERDQRVRERLLQQGDGDAGDGEAGIEGSHDDGDDKEVRVPPPTPFATPSESQNTLTRKEEMIATASPAATAPLRDQPTHVPPAHDPLALD